MGLRGKGTIVPNSWSYKSADDGTAPHIPAAILLTLALIYRLYRFDK